MDPSDLELVLAIRGGDSAAFEALYRRHRDWVVTQAFRFCGDRDEALDVLQETFAYFARKAPGFELRCAFRSFLYPVVRHLALDRRAARRPHAPLDRANEPEAGPAEPDAIDDYLGNLPPAHREVVRLRFVEGLSLEEIAGALEIPLGTVKSRLHNALETLRKNLPAR